MPMIVYFFPSYRQGSSWRSKNAPRWGRAAERAAASRGHGGDIVVEPRVLGLIGTLNADSDLKKPESGSGDGDGNGNEPAISSQTRIAKTHAHMYLV